MHKETQNLPWEKSTMGEKPNHPSFRRISNQEPQVQCHNEETLAQQNVCSSRKTHRQDSASIGERETIAQRLKTKKRMSPYCNFSFLAAVANLLEKRTSSCRCK
jgi:hypothetical protein